MLAPEKVRDVYPVPSTVVPTTPDAGEHVTLTSLCAADALEVFTLRPVMATLVNVFATGVIVT